MSESKPPYWSSQRLFQSFSIDAKAAGIEFVGTTFFFLLGLGGIQAATGESLQSGSTIEQTLYIATSMGFSLLVTAWLFYRVTGGLFNPNITLALFLVGVVSPVRFVLFCIAQMQGINSAQGVFIEMFITAALVIAVLMLAAEKHSATPFAPVKSFHLFVVE
ncbi:aquaporin-like protein [Boletus reticuloceps]|uniref:Aquaporin-like protein n=1 Tax=Boletus reticuloceps TaxID=495285 RepID=A0A8I2YD16_9AGAM|nr:aquaporin-like protein [Boletus reticuloceps]